MECNFTFRIYRRSQMRWKDHIPTIKWMLENGKTITDLTDYYKVEGDKIRAAIRLHLPHLAHKVRKPSVWEERAVTIEKMLRDGKTLKEVGDVYGVSRQRVKQVVQEYLPHLKNEVVGHALKVKEEKDAIRAARDLKWGRDDYHFNSDALARAMSRAFSEKRRNARYTKWGWEIERGDLEFPLVCPILGIELDWFAKKRKENSPSFDRIDSSKGYVKGNVVICSWRANRIKNDGTSEEHLKIAEFLANCDRVNKP